MRTLIVMLVCGATPLLLLGTARGEEDTVDWLLKTKATTAPVTRPAATQPSSPLVRPHQNAEGLHGVITLSNGKSISGTISTTPGKPLRVWVEQEHQYKDVELGAVAEMTAKVLWEREEKEWHFIASGSDVKEYTGRTYPAHELEYTLKLRDGSTVTGGVVAPLYVEATEGQVTLVLHKRDKGATGRKLEDLVYVQRVQLTDPDKP